MMFPGAAQTPMGAGMMGMGMQPMMGGQTPMSPYAQKQFKREEKLARKEMKAEMKIPPMMGSPQPTMMGMPGQYGMQ